MLGPGAVPALWRIFEEVGRRQVTDELGNGRFVRTLIEHAGQARDVRVLLAGIERTINDLVTITAQDLERAFAELTSHLRDRGNVPTLENALADLDELAGLELVKHQVLAITAQLRVGMLRGGQGPTGQQLPMFFIFTGLRGSGKRTVARILGRIFAAVGLLTRPDVTVVYGQTWQENV